MVRSWWCSLGLVIAVGVGVAGCGSDGSSATANPSGQLSVFAPSSLTGAFTELGEAFEQVNPTVTVTLNFAASSELATQIIEGAPADVFASADLANMTKVVDAELVAGQPTVFATNTLEIIVAPGNPLGIANVADLADPELIIVSCAPQVPCGSYATQVFANAGVDVTPDSFEENVKAVVAKVTLGEADAGLVYITDVLAAGDKAGGIAIPRDLNVVAEYPIAVIADADDPVAAQAFIDYVQSAPGQRILASFGFVFP